MKPAKLSQLIGLTSRRCMSQSAAAHHLAQADQPIKPFAAIPSPPRLPVLGHIPLLLKNQNRLHKFFDELRQEHGEVFRVSMQGLGETVVIFNPEHIQQVYSLDGPMPILPGFHALERMRREELPDVFTDTTGLISQGEDWYHFRQAVQQDMMRVSSALHYVADIQDIAQELADKIAKSRAADGILDPLPLLHEFALESIGCIFLESRLGVLKGDPDGKAIIKQADYIFSNVMPILFLPYWLARRLPFFRQLIACFREMSVICTKHVKKAITTMENDQGQITSNSGVLAKMVQKCGKDSNVPVIMALDAMGAGIDTTGNTGAFLLYHLASNEEKQEKLYRELKDVLGQTGGRITEAKLGQLKYLKACQKESQRMLPVVIGTGRTTQVEMTLGGYQIPVGTTILRAGQVTSNQGIHFPDPDKFIPERWLRGCPERHQASSFANLPFGHGPRSCVGQRFAQLELQVLAATMVQRFKMEYSGPPVDTVTTFVSKPDRPIAIRFTER